MRQNISSRLTHTRAMWLVQTFRQVSRSLALQQRRVQVARSLIMHCTSLCFSFPVPYLDPADRNWTWPYRQRTKYNSDLFYRSRSFTSTDVETGLDGISEAEFPGPTLFRPLGVFHEGRTCFFFLFESATIVASWLFFLQKMGTHQRIQPLLQDAELFQKIEPTKESITRAHSSISLHQEKRRKKERDK